MNKLYKAFLCSSVFMLHCCGTAVVACDVSVNRMTTVETNPATGIPTEKMLSCAKKRDNPNFRAKLQKEFCTPDKINALKINELFKEIALEGVVATSEKILKAIEESGHFDKFYALIDPKNHKKFGFGLSKNEVFEKIKELTLNTTNPEAALNDIVNLVEKNREILGNVSIVPYKDSYELRKIEEELESIKQEKAKKAYFEKRLISIRDNLAKIDKPEQDDARRVAALAYLKSDPEIYNLFSWMNANGIKPFKTDTNLMEFARLIDVCTR